MSNKKLKPKKAKLGKSSKTKTISVKKAIVLFREDKKKGKQMSVREGYGAVAEDTDTISQLSNALESAKETIEKQQQILIRINTDPHTVGTVLDIGEKKVAVSVNRQIYLVEIPEVKIAVGDQVACALETNQIISVSKFHANGQIAVVKKVIDGQHVEIGGDGVADILVFPSKMAGKLEIGDRVMLDQSGQVILRNLGQPKQAFAFNGETGVSWKDIGGHETAKEQMIEAIELPYRYPDLFKKYNKKPIKGVLLYGPPGCGKTMLGKATATSIRELHKGQGAETGFIYVKGPEVLAKFVGVAEETVRSIFGRARKHKEKFGYPAVVFIDEADAILRKRGSGISSDIESTVVPAFLAEMDGLDDTGAIVILATNRQDTLDNAVTRDGRIDRSIKIERPNEKNALSIFNLHLRNVPLAGKLQPGEIAKIGVQELFSAKRVLYSFKRKDGSKLSFTLGNLCNGAMIAGVISQASSIALRRDLVAGNTSRFGITPQDIVAAINNTFHQNVDLNHKDELSDFLEPIRDQISNVEKLRQVSAA